MTRRERGSRGLIWPALLIGLGLLFLFNNLGLLSWDIWLFIARFWPLILIGVGLDILLSGRGRWLAALAVALLGLALWTFWSGVQPGSQAALTQSISQPAQGARRAEIHIAPGVASLHLEAVRNTNSLIQGTVRTARGERLEQDFRRQGDTAVYSLESRHRGVSFPWTGGGDRRLWNLQLAAQIPTSLDIDAGVGELELDLRQLELADLSLDAGVGKATLTLPAGGPYEAEVSMGVGDTTVRIPRGLAARIVVSKGIGSVAVPSGFERSGETYLSPNYRQANDRIDLRIDGGVGSIRVVEY